MSSDWWCACNGTKFSAVAAIVTHILPDMDNVDRRLQLGRRIRSLREAQGISLRRFALMCSTSHSYIGDVEKGRLNVGFDMLCSIADSLGMSVSELLEGVDQGSAHRSRPD